MKAIDSLIKKIEKSEFIKEIQRSIEDLKQTKECHTKSHNAASEILDSVKKKMKGSNIPSDLLDETNKLKNFIQNSPMSIKQLEDELLKRKEVLKSWKEKIKDIDFLKEVIEDINSLQIIDETEGRKIVTETNIPQSLKEAKEREEPPYHKVERVMDMQKGDYTSFFKHVLHEDYFLEIVKAVAELNLSQEKRITQTPRKINETKLEKNANILAGDPSIVNQFMKEEEEEFAICPSLTVLSELRIGRMYLDNEEYQLSSRSYFKAGRAYESSIYKPFEPCIKSHFKRKPKSKKEKHLKYGEMYNNLRLKYMVLGSGDREANKKAKEEIKQTHIKEYGKSISDRSINNYETKYLNWKKLETARKEKTRQFP